MGTVKNSQGASPSNLAQFESDATDTTATYAPSGATNAGGLQLRGGELGNYVSVPPTFKFGGVFSLSLWIADGGRASYTVPFKLNVGVTGHAYLLEIEGLFTQGSRPGRTFGESVGGILEMDSSD